MKIQSGNKRKINIKAVDLNPPTAKVLLMLAAAAIFKAVATPPHPRPLARESA